jgi:hypothetical protein
MSASYSLPSPVIWAVRCGPPPPLRSSSPPGTRFRGSNRCADFTIKHGSSGGELCRRSALNLLLAFALDFPLQLQTYSGKVAPISAMDEPAQPNAIGLVPTGNPGPAQVSTPARGNGTPAQTQPGTPSARRPLVSPGQLAPLRSSQETSSAGRRQASPGQLARLRSSRTTPSARRHQAPQCCSLLPDPARQRQVRDGPRPPQGCSLRPHPARQPQVREAHAHP